LAELMAQPRADLLGCGHIAVLARDDPTDPQRRGPTGAAPGELDRPGGVPARDDRLAMKMATLW